MQWITSTSNKQIKNIIQLQKKARERKNQGLFVVEGPRMVCETPEELLEEIYVSESFLQRPEMKEIQRDHVTAVSDSVFAHMSDTATPQGILAVVRQPAYCLEDLLHPSCPHLLLLERVQDPGNLGTMFRTGEGAGVTGIIMSRDTADLFSPKVVRSTMGSIYRVPFVYADDFGDAIASVRQSGVKLYAAHLKGQKDYDGFDYTGPCGFLIGNEGNGLTDETAGMADDYLRIPMEGRLESLNAAMAAGILMYEVHRQRSKEN